MKTEEGKFEEIIYPPEPEIEISGICPSCGGGLVFGVIPCPEGRRGCCVIHYGYTCRCCGKIFQKKE